MAERIPPGKAAAICGLSRKTLVKLAQKGKIPGAAELDEGLWRFDEAALRGWLRRREAACRETGEQTSTRGGKRGGLGSRFNGGKLDEAYEQALRWKPGSA